MKQNDMVLKIPYGTRDFLPQEAKRKRMIENAIAGLFTRWGYDEVVTPTFEYAETLVAGAGNDILQDMFKFFDKSNQILVLRPDMTTPIARVAATRLKEDVLPVKLFYLTNVFRYEQAQAGRQCEFYQAGVELLGGADAAADAEVVALAVESMLEAGLQNFQISLGQVRFINGIMEESGLSAGERQLVKHFMVSRDLVGLGEVLQKSALDAAAQELLQNIPLFYGKEDMLNRVYGLVRNETSRQALTNLSSIYQLLTAYGVEKYVNFDLGIIRDFDYYTGMVFEGYTPGLGFPLCGGGRYDKMLASFGVDCPATGFALGIERVLLALERQGISVACEPKDIYIGWLAGKLPQAIGEAGRLRRQGRTVELALSPQTEAEAEAERCQKGYGTLLYIGG
ncbi:histidyl-trna synthetase [Lucifera butyrica]|uniref:ATP phosphoribosyltransferase regulatory subunit n=1 Tax=Lucifera butyrica TaxID=1351585 RepID=A0A498R6H2_9FIRM|nr:ATP phosphoribosyltransferase regulatory subunit [Lucifera butyrica]VBB05862.1 histidyl-trna synthetase [Lucifera butyrica]